MKLMTTHEMAKRIGGLTLWSSQLSEELGIEPAGNILKGDGGYGYTEDQFVELCDALIDRIQLARHAAVHKPQADDLEDL